MLRVLTLLMLFLVPVVVHAALIPFVKKTTNDGVFSLSEEQAAFLGDRTATHIAFLRLRKGRGINWRKGDTLNLDTVLNSTQHDHKILGVFNGVHGDLNYDGDAFTPFVSATIHRRRGGYFRGVAFTFAASVGNISFNGTSTFNAGQTRRTADFIALPQLSENLQSTQNASQSATAVPEPSILALYLAAACMLFMTRQLHSRRRV